VEWANRKVDGIATEGCAAIVTCYAFPTVTGEPAPLDASVITEPLDSMVAALGYKLEREWPANRTNILGARELLLLTLRTADVTSRSIRWLCADKPVDSNRRLEYCLSVPPLNRTILDNLFTVIFVLEDLPARSLWYHRAAWREERIELNRYRAEYGRLPEWQEWLARLTAHSELGVRMFGLSAQEIADPSKMTSWPNPGAMIKYRVSPAVPMPPTRVFMKYLDDWFYADLSQQAHLGGTGLMKRASSLLLDRNDPERVKALTKNKYSWMGQSFAMMLALSSEIEARFRFGLRERIEYLWNVTSSVVVVAREMYEKRYAELLKQTTY